MTPVTSRLLNSSSFSPAVSRETCTAGPPMFSRAMIRITRIGCGRPRGSGRAIPAPVPLDRLPQPLQEGDFGLVAQQAARLLDIRPRVLDITRARLGMHGCEVLPGDLLEHLDQPVERDLRAGRHVEHLPRDL